MTSALRQHDAHDTAGTAEPRCRFCESPLRDVFADLGTSPLCESFVRAEDANIAESIYPLKAWVCGTCFLVQLEEMVDPVEIFPEYAYFSSYSDAWLAHARDYVGAMTESLGLGSDSLVVELASNDGYLLQYFVERGIPVLGIDPAANVAKAAEERGVPTMVEFFDEALGARLAKEGRRADLVLGNNVLAQVSDLHTFVAGIRHLLAPDGVCTIEFPHLQRLMEENQFDTIYHEHYSYFSLVTAERIFAAHGMQIHDVEELWTHGGSLRIFASHAGTRPGTARLADVRERERAAGLESLGAYAAFEEQVRETKRALLEFLIEAKRDGKTIVGYGAPGKANTLLNYCGIRQDFVDFVVDRNPYKHGRLMPGSRIPIRPVEALAEARPDIVLILPWNLREEIVGQLSYVSDWGGRLAVPIPRIEIVGGGARG